MKSMIELISEEQTVGQKIRLGLEANSLKSNSAFTEAMVRLHKTYTALEDQVTLANDPDADKHRYHYSLMRTLIIDLANEIDAVVSEGENAKAQLEQPDLLEE